MRPEKGRERRGQERGTPVTREPAPFIANCSPSLILTAPSTSLDKDYVESLSRINLIKRGKSTEKKVENCFGTRMKSKKACVFVKFGVRTVYASGASISFHFQLHRPNLFSCHNSWRWITRNISVDHLTSVLFRDIDHDMIYSSRREHSVQSHQCTSQIVSYNIIAQQNVLSNNHRWWCYLKKKVLNHFSGDFIGAEDTTSNKYILLSGWTF